MKPREWSWFNRIFFALFIVVLIGVIIFLAWQRNEEKTTSAQERSQLISALAQSNGQLRDVGIEPKAPEPEQIVTGTTGPQGRSGEPGPRGPAGEDGTDGLNGEPGTPGGAGSPGQAGPTGSTGPSGPPGPDGATGPAGPVGPTGADGRGIQSLFCDELGRWTVTYTDGVTADAGACLATIEGVIP